MQNSLIEGLFIELNLRSTKWLFSCSYNPHLSLISERLSIIGKNLDFFSAEYDNIFLMGDLNAEPHDNYLKDFCLMITVMMITVMMITVNPMMITVSKI